MATPTKGTTEQPADGHKAGFPPFKAETFASQLFWLAICFAALYVMVAKIALPRVSGILAARSAKIEADLAEATRMKGDADAAVAAYEKALAEARNRAHAIATETREKLAADSDAHRKQVETELSARLAVAESEIAAKKQAAMSNVRDIAVETAGAIVDRLSGTTPTGDAVTAAVDRVLAK